MKQLRPWALVVIGACLVGTGLLLARSMRPQADQPRRQARSESSDRSVTPDSTDQEAHVMAPAVRLALETRVPPPTTLEPDQLQVYMMRMPLESGLNDAERDWLLVVAISHSDIHVRGFAVGCLGDLALASRKSPETLRRIADLAGAFMSDADWQNRRAGGGLALQRDLGDPAVVIQARQLAASDPEPRVREALAEIIQSIDRAGGLRK